MELITGENDEGRRLDRILRKALPDHPLPLIHRLLRQGLVLVNGKKAKAQDRVNSGVKIYIPSQSQSADFPKNALKNPSRVIPSPKILWEACGLIAVNKPAGLSVHGQTDSDNLNEMVLSYLADKITPSLSFKPGPLHRLDKPTSGIVIFSTNIEGARLFSSLMREQKLKKTYLAIIEGNVKKDDVWEDALLRDKEMKKTFVSENGKNAITTIKPLVSKNGYSLIEAQIATGRTHQIRAQAAAHGHPLAGDKKYGGNTSEAPRGRGSGIFLHAWKLEFLQSFSASIEAPLPAAFERKISELFNIKILA